MNNDIWTANKLRNINTLFFIGFIFLCYFFGKERAILFDGSRAIYIVSNYKYPFFDENRFPVLINTILPLIVSYLNFSTKYILYAYILSYTLLPISIFVFFRFIAKDEKQLSIFLVSLSLLFFHAFFVASHDTVTIYYYTFFLYYLLSTKINIKKYYYYLFVIFFTTLVIFGHLSQVITLVLMIGYLILEKKLNINFIILMFIILLLLTIKIFLFKGETESELLNINTAQYIFPLSQNQTLIGFFKSLFGVNSTFTLLWIFSISIIIYRKKYYLCLFLISSTISVVCFVSIIFSKYLSFSYYTEPHLKGLSFLLSIILINETLIILKSYQRLIILTVTYLFALCTIYLYGLKFIEYYNYISSLSKQLTQNTIFYSTKSTVTYAYSFLPIESAIINACENNNTYYFAFTSVEKLNEIGFIPEQRNNSIFKFNDKPIYKKELPQLKAKIMLKYQNSYGINH